MEQQHPYKPYIVPVRINDKFVSIRDTRYPITSIPPSGEGRFHRPGQQAWYAASGTPTALAEVYRNPAAQITPPHALFTIPSGDYILFDLRQYTKDHPDSIAQFYSGDKYKDWVNCQNLRNELGAVGCSGVIYESAAIPGGINIVLWPLNGTPLKESFFQHMVDFE